MNQASTPRRLLVALALLSAALLAPASLAAQGRESPDKIWKPIEGEVTFDADGLSSLQETGPRLPPKEKRRFFRLNVGRLRNALSPTAGRGRARAGGSLSSVAADATPQTAAAPEVWLPLPDGRYERFAVEESPMMEPELAAQFPSIKSYRGQGIDDPTLTAHVTVTEDGVSAIVLSPDDTFYIDPTPRRRGDNETHLSAFRSDIPAGPIQMRCNVTGDGGGDDSARPDARPATLSSGETLRTYRLAVAATGEYTKFHGRKVDRAFRAIYTTVARVNAIYQRDLAIQLTLVNGQRNIIYTNAANDPYTNGDDGVMIGENQRNLDQVIGAANYDIGHVFGTGDGGRARVGSVGRDGDKARGVTNLSRPVGDRFDVDYVAHEMGHQFGANHTFNGTTSSCGGNNRKQLTAYEPGSGTTIMGYAGICGPDNIQDTSDDYFHAASLEEIIAYVTRDDVRNVPRLTATNNRPPTVDGGRSYTIPKGTPFVLTAAGADPDNDRLTYTWEQLDTGDPAPPDDDLAAPRPIFRSMKPVREAARVFPRMPFLLGADDKRGETLPTRSRVLTFRATARDNRAKGGGVGFGTTTVNVITDAGPFAVTQPARGATWRRGSEQTVTWEVAGTNLAPLSVERVRITLSDDGGATFRHVLAADAPNSGEFRFTVPAGIPATDRVRVKVEGVGNIFFNVSPGNFRVVN